ncbi:MAG: NAD(P) transhydrogenase subunit alpha [Rickettsiales bacterium]
MKKSISKIESLSGEIVTKAKQIVVEAGNAGSSTTECSNVVSGVDPFVFAVTVFILACFIGYYVVWKVTPALHTPLMSVTNAISGIIIVGAMIALGPKGMGVSQVVGFISVVIASINIFGGFVVTNRMLQMFKKKSK